MAPSDKQTDAPAVEAAAKSQPPHLASRALMEDLAPVEPYRGLIRLWCALSGLALGGSAALTYLGQGVVPPIHVALAAVALLAALVPIPYAARATVAMAVAVLSMALGVLQLGPLAPLTGTRVLIHAVAAGALPAALLFRANYRAYPGARSILAITLVLTLPFVAYCILTLSRDGLPIQIASGVALALLAPALLGFMGSETTIAGQYLAGLVIFGISGQLSSEIIGGAWPLTFDNAELKLLTALAVFALLCTLAALAIFQLLAWRHWDHARIQSVRQRAKSRAPLLSLGDSWSSRN